MQLHLQKVKYVKYITYYYLYLAMIDISLYKRKGIDVQNNFIQIQGDKVIIDKNSLVTLAVVVVLVIVVVAIVTIAAKSRKKNFIKTIPTNLKEEE